MSFQDQRVCFFTMITTFYKLLFKTETMKVKDQLHISVQTCPARPQEKQDDHNFCHSWQYLLYYLSEIVYTNIFLIFKAVEG